MTESEKRALEPSPCTKTPKRGHSKIYHGLTEGCNERYEQDKVTLKSLGHSITEGFRMISDDDQPDGE